MRIHTDYHNPSTVSAALLHCQAAGLIHPDVRLAVNTEHRSRSRRRGIEVQLGAPEGTPWFLPEPSRRHLDSVAGDKAILVASIRAASIRRPRNGGTHGASGESLRMAATWHEWGYFLAALFHDDPAMTAAYYTSIGDFEAKTLHNPWRTAGGRAADFLTAVKGIMPATAAA